MDIRTDLADDARSVLACARDVTLVVDGVGSAAGADCDARCDLRGTPVLTFPEDSDLALAALGQAVGEMTVTSGLGRPVDRDRRLVLVLAGRLRAAGVESCTCCPARHRTVRLPLERITLLDGERAHEVDLARFSDPRLALNRGHLQRTTEHANEVHGPELLQSVAVLLDRPPGSLLAASLAGVDREGCTLQWLDDLGSHRRRVPFAVPVRTPGELASALAAALDPH
ncbi:DUF2470 domain-containing protein [Auraticoccus monumenti]|uniref:DUF2470 domain-containing protein n=1 Tax=Auraticoccus monumenti TaxID=675864 RepID=A0A1G6T1W9_9ACTN|nr:DUF2470 domain-containing protein [Auraticoccus monumenti]SDD22963.1 Protein of unknown function [Auraticoccus monumenti]